MHQRLTQLCIVILFWPMTALGTPDLLRLPPAITATSWGIADAVTGQLVFSSHQGEIKHIASLSKMMTALVVLDEVQRTPGLLGMAVAVSKKADHVFGTTATIQAGERLTIEQLLYGLMLPSGNDAAITLAEYIGRRLDNPSRLDSMTRFVKAMNMKASELGMSDTVFVDVHGLGQNVSTVVDLVKLSRTVMSNVQFRKLVATQEYSLQIQTAKGEMREMRWRNTNELLAGSSFHGIKTGYTNTAGGCLILAGDYEDLNLIVVVLGSSTRETRFLDAYNLFQWGVRELSYQDASGAP